MSESVSAARGKLAEVFAKINMSELPAMSVHVQELLSLTSDKRSANYDDLARIILKDFSLTHKVLQCANSAYYALGQKVSTVSMAVAVLGFDTVRDLALGIALFDDFIRAGVNTDEISELLARSFMAGLLARRIAESRYLKVLPEEAFICGLMRNLGKIIACIYLPGVYNDITVKVRDGVAEEEAARDLLDGLDYSEIGREVAIFWNMTESVIQCMDANPAVPEDDHDPDRNLHCLVDFSTRYVDALWGRRNIDALMDKYGYVLSIDEDEVVEMLTAAASESAAIFDSIRPGIARFDFRERLEQMRAAARPIMSISPPDAASNKGLRSIEAMLTGEFHLKACLAAVLEGLIRDVEADRAIFAMLKLRENDRILIGQMGRGDLVPAQLEQFAVPVAKMRELVMGFPTRAGDLALAPDVVGRLPETMQDLLRQRHGYLFPLLIEKKIVALLYVDRKSGTRQFAREEIELVRHFRDLATRAIELKRKTNRMQK